MKIIIDQEISIDIELKEEMRATKFLEIAEYLRKIMRINGQMQLVENILQNKRTRKTRMMNLNNETEDKEIIRKEMLKRRERGTWNSKKFRKEFIKYYNENGGKKTAEKYNLRIHTIYNKVQQIRNS